MALQKQNIPLNFAQGLDTKSDPYQVPPGKMLELTNSIFTKTGLLKKRNGFSQITTSPTSSYLTTFKSSLVSIGDELSSYSQGTNSWIDKGQYLPLTLSTLSLIKNGLNQSSIDMAVSENGLVCVVYNNGGTYTYSILDITTGENLLGPIYVQSPFGSIAFSPRVYSLGTNFIIIFPAYNGSTYHLQYIPINQYNLQYSIATDLATGIYANGNCCFEAAVANNTLYVAFSKSVLSVIGLTSQLALTNIVPISTVQATTVSVCVDETGSLPVIHITYWATNSNIYASSISSTFSVNFSDFEIAGGASMLSLTTIALNSGSIAVFYEVANTYAYTSGIQTNYIVNLDYASNGSSHGGPNVLIRNLGLASKSFFYNGNIYFLAIQYSYYQPTYFLIQSYNGLDANIVMKLAYQNAGGYISTGLPSIYINENQVLIPYLFKDLLESVNNSGMAQVYSQTGINLATIQFDVGTSSVEIGNNLLLSGGFLWGYDGTTLVENNFFLWPEYVLVEASGSSGSMSAQTYFYQVTYEWTDNQGNIFRSTPSIIEGVALSGHTAMQLYIPTLRLTYKANVTINIYRASTNQATYFSLFGPGQSLSNNTGVDYVAFLDTLADGSIIGNTILYTTGGVVEDTNGPATNLMTLFDARMWLVSSEDNTLWFSKQVLQATPVEFSDLFTMYIPPSIGAQGSTGNITALSVMDDKLVIFKKDAIYFINGIGPDNTGTNSQYSQPYFITSTIGCANQNSIVFIPDGLMFQSDKGIWVLTRSLQTQYVGAPVEAFNSDLVTSALTIPGTNQVRFTLNNGTILMYDYYFGQWGTFTGVPGISSTLYQGYHTVIESTGAVFQETPNVFLDGSNPVLMSFTTAWFHFTGLQGFQRAYYFYLLGTYISPHKLAVTIAYDYNPANLQTTIITPDNFTPNFGNDSKFGSVSTFGGISTLEQYRVHLQNQLCQSFQISIQEVYDPSLGVSAGEGLSISGLDLTIGSKDSKPRLKVSRNVG